MGNLRYMKSFHNSNKVKGRLHKQQETGFIAELAEMEIASIYIILFEPNIKCNGIYFSCDVFFTFDAT